MSDAVPTIPAAIEGVLAVGVLLTEFALLRLLWVEGIIRNYALQSFIVALFTAAVGLRTSNPDLYLLAALTLVIKAVGIPTVISMIVRRLGVDDRIPASVPVPLSFLIGAALAAVGFAAATKLSAGLHPGIGLQIGLSIVLIGFFLMTARANAVAQLIGFLSLENGVFVASVSLAAGMPLIAAVLLLLDVLVPAAAFLILIRVLANRHRSLHTIELTELRG